MGYPSCFDPAFNKSIPRANVWATISSIPSDIALLPEQESWFCLCKPCATTIARPCPWLASHKCHRAFRTRCFSICPSPPSSVEASGRTLLESYLYLLHIHMPLESHPFQRWSHCAGDPDWIHIQGRHPLSQALAYGQGRCSSR